jgi:hypothetical protein
VEKAINQMEEVSANDESQTSGEVLSELLLSIKLTIPFKAESKNISKIAGTCNK